MEDGFPSCIQASMRLDRQQHFVYRKSMNVRALSLKAEDQNDLAVARVAAAIGEPSRARMIFCLMDGHARTATELAIVAEVSPSTASVHLHRLETENLVKVLVQGKHRYYSIAGTEVAAALEALLVVAGGARRKFTPSAPFPLRSARTCYDHMAGAVAVSLHNRFTKLGWIQPCSKTDDALELSTAGVRAFEGLGIDVQATRCLRRRFAYACLDWSERKPHIGGALGAALLEAALRRKWVLKDLDSRALSITRAGQRELDRFGIVLDLQKTKAGF
jgi:DNA-binding transcriptional ArsR family regulator